MADIYNKLQEPGISSQEQAFLTEQLQQLMDNFVLVMSYDQQMVCTLIFFWPIIPTNFHSNRKNWYHILEIQLRWDWPFSYTNYVCILVELLIILAILNTSLYQIDYKVVIWIVITLYPFSTGMKLCQNHCSCTLL